MRDMTFKNGRLKIVVLLAVCLVALFALSSVAYAASWANQYPVGTVAGQPPFVSAQLFGATGTISSATLAIDGGAATKATVDQGVGQGFWTQGTQLVGGVYVIKWTYTAGTPGLGSATIAGYPSTLSTGTPHTAVLTATGADAATYTTSFVFTLTDQVTVPPVIPPSAATTQTCRSSNCHGTTFDNDVAMGPVCTDCHIGGFGPHEFSSDNQATGHNTTLLGTFGAKTWFDGTQGVTLQYESEIASASLNATWLVGGQGPVYAPLTGNHLGAPISSITTGQVGTLTTQWAFPTSNAFWDPADPEAPSTAIKGLTSASVVTCEDCHTGLAPAGPQGAAATNSGLDPNYPGDYSYAELTKWSTCNTQYSVTQPEYTNSPAISGSGISMFPGAATHSNITSTSIVATVGLIPTTLPANVTGLSARTDGTKGATAVICAKCHDLEDLNASNTVSGDNTAHNSHHQDQLDGSAQCVNCHLGLPHAWKRPRLLVNTDVDVAPILDPQHLGTTRTTSTGDNVGNTIKGFGLGQGTAFGSGFNGQGMQSLSAVDNHTLVTSGGTLGMTNWTEASCQACGDHAGEDGIRIKE